MEFNYHNFSHVELVFQTGCPHVTILESAEYNGETLTEDQIEELNSDKHEELLYDLRTK